MLKRFKQFCNEEVSGRVLNVEFETTVDAEDVKTQLSTKPYNCVVSQEGKKLTINCTDNDPQEIMSVIDRFPFGHKYVNEKLDNKKQFNNLYDWKMAVLNSGFRYKLQKANDKTDWIAFSDSDAETKGLFKTEKEYLAASDGSISKEANNLSGVGYVMM